jgi:hypothetical protein
MTFGQMIAPRADSDTKIWPVIVSDWEIECCGTPPGVGDHVQWTLYHVGYAEDPLSLPEEALVTLPLDDRVEQLPNGLRVTRDGGLVVYLSPKEMGGEPEARGTIHEGHHHIPPAEIPPTEGAVRRVQVVTCLYMRGEGPLEFVPVRPKMREVSRSPKRFSIPKPIDERYLVGEIGVLVDLEVAAPGGS